MATLTIDSGGPVVAGLVNPGLDVALAAVFGTDAAGSVTIPGKYLPYVNGMKAHWEELVARRYSTGAPRHFQVVLTFTAINETSTPAEIVTLQITTATAGGSTAPSGSLV